MKVRAVLSARNPAVLQCLHVSTNSSSTQVRLQAYLCCCFGRNLIVQLAAYLVGSAGEHGEAP